MNKQELKTRILSSRDQLDATLSKISDQRSEMVILHGEWSVKDLLGHLGFWENRAVTLFSSLQAHQSPEPVRNIDELNEGAIHEMRSLSWIAVKEFEEKAHQDILDLVDRATEPELFDPAFFAWTQGKSFSEIISDNTWGHYEEHLPELFAWLKRIA